MIALLAVMLLLAVAATVMFWPLRAGRRGGPGRDRGAVDPALSIARDAKLGEINDLELDFRLGKLSSEDFAAVNATLRAEAVELLRRIESDSGSDAP
jgi:hypothetical protein